MLRTLGALLCLTLPFFAFTNNIAVTSVLTTGQNAGTGNTTVQFDLSWENSWRVNTGAVNWDAAWVFVKYRANGGDWQHATLAGPGAIPADAVVDVMDGTGAMVYRATTGSGNVVYDDVQLRWDYTGDGLTTDDLIDVRVFAIEMVFVPEGAYALGDGRDDQNQFYAGGTALQPYLVSSEAAIAVADSPGNLFYSNRDSGAGDQTGSINPAFPKGFAAFYVAKYETSQQQWVDFFNTLPQSVRPDFDLTRDPEYIDAGTNKANNRVTAYLEAEQNDVSTTHPAIPVNYVNQVQALAYLDWAGLRPWTELEFEKVGRGTEDPVDGAYAHGTNTVDRTLPAVSNQGTPTSRITNQAADVGHFVHAIPRNNEGNGPLRCGITAASATNFTRLETGGSFYGVMEQSGNLWERIVTVGTSQGRGFVGNHGDGTLDTDGTHNVSGWPAGSETAFGIKGCAYVSGGGTNEARTIRCSVSARRNAAGNRNKGDHDYALFRGVRSL